MNVKSFLSNTIVKPIVAGAVAGLADHFVMGNQDFKSNAMFAGAVGGGIFSVSWIEPIVSPMFPTHTPFGAIGKALEGRVVEITLGSAGAYAINHFLLKNEYTTQDLWYKLGIIAVADVIGETVCELIIL